MGIAVYSDGKYIELFYNLDGSEEWPRTEVKYKRSNTGEYEYDDIEWKKGENQKYFEETSYI